MERFEFPRLGVPKLELGSISLPTLPIPKVDLKTPRIVGAIERLQQENLINEIDRLNYDIKLKKNEKSNCEKRLNSIESSVDITVGVICSIIVAIISVVIPFVIVSFNNYLLDFQIQIFVYMVSSFILSMAILLGYLIYSYKNKKY